MRHRIAATVSYQLDYSTIDARPAEARQSAIAVIVSLGSAPGSAKYWQHEDGIPEVKDVYQEVIARLAIS